MSNQKKLWSGRFEKGLSGIVEQFSESISFDRRLYRQDILGSKAHSNMLVEAGLMTAEERDAVHAGLAEIQSEIEAGTFEFRQDREDIHMNIEGALIERIGDPARKLHTARSRNDQIATDVRLYMREEIDALIQRIRSLQRALFDLAEKSRDVILPGYTHLQRAQPILAPHHLMAYMDQLDRDMERLGDCRRRVNRSPLGAGALAGTTLPVNRHQTSEELGFDEPIQNSIDAVSDRDHIIELISACAIISMHLSRLAEEWVLWASEEFGFIKMDDSVATGSSIMPQKKNPDPMELVRGKTGRVYGHLMSILTVTKGLPQAYNRDFQEDKEPLFDALDTVYACLQVTEEFARNIEFNRARIEASLGQGHLDATTLADYLVLKGLPFRSAHAVVGKLVHIAVNRSLPLDKLALSQFQAECNLIEQDVFDFLGVKNCVRRFQSYGSTGPGPVADQMAAWKSRLTGP
ncbi:MAG: argininosuccinate lyase [Planctomycetota bacterium]|nr:argininosuccinate lyase [Planctomycetota bacterium]MDA1140828.1 argininosuccinate lyase [Planctomycetota bacterium]